MASLSKGLKLLRTDLVKALSWVRGLGFVVPPMEAQQIFNKVSKHLFAQGTRAVAMPEEGGGCKYRGDKGYTCAVGCILPDELYRPDMEDQLVSYLYKTPEVVELFGLGNERLLEDLQAVHDQIGMGTADSAWLSTRTMRVALGKVARTHRLDASILTTLSFKDR